MVYFSVKVEENMTKILIIEKNLSRGRLFSWVSSGKKLLNIWNYAQIRVARYIA
jgi:hypothetical protein